MRTRTAAGVLVLSLAATLGLGSTAGAAADDRTVTPSAKAAKQALTAAQKALAPKAKPSHDVTLTLRDLFEAQAGLTGADLKAAQTIRLRPTDPGDDDYYGAGADVETECSLVCVYWVNGPANDPETDEGQGGSPMTDVYIAEISDYAYGYCDTDMTEYSPDDFAVYTYCVLDDDYAFDEFPTNTPLENMQVTAAHEYFHAVQGAYDWSEDAWLMENTATWAEDELFDDVNDNVFYLPFGQMGDPALYRQGYEGPGYSLDGSYGLNVYGNWVFYRHLTEMLPDEEGGLPVLMREIWENADSTNGATNDQYSLRAISHALDQAGVPFRAAYTSFALANRDPRAHYEEGDLYPKPPLSSKPVTLTPKHRKTTWGKLTQDHLTNDTVRFKPGTTMSASAWKLKVQVDMAPENRGSVAMVTVFFKDGEAGVKQISLDGQGDGATKVPFFRGEVSYVELSMVNASERTRCWNGNGLFSCSGTPRDDGMKVEFRGVASR